MPSFIGTGADQVPVNSMLGSLAYQNADDVKLGKVTYSGDLLGLGSLGVGTLTPVYKIHAYGAGSTIIGVEGTTDASFITRLSGVQALYLHSTTTASEINELRNVPLNVAVNGAIRWTIDGNGNSSLGGSPISNGRTFSIVNSTTGNSSFYLQNSTTGFTTSDGTVLQVTGSAAYLWNFENGTISLGTNNTEFLRITSTGDALNLGTGATKVQEGTTAQRPASPQEGMIRKNSTTGKNETYLRASWRSIPEEEQGVNLIDNPAFSVVNRPSTLSRNNSSSFIMDRWYWRATNTSASTSLSNTVFNDTSVYGYGLTFTNNTLIASLPASSICCLRQTVFSHASGVSKLKTGYMTLSFLVRGSVPGTYSLCVQSGSTDVYTTTYSVLSSSSFNRVSITFPTPPTLTNALILNFNIGTGTDNQTASLNAWLASSSPKFANTGINLMSQASASTLTFAELKLELGDVMTPFTMKDYLTDLNNCMRHYQNSYDIGTSPGATASYGGAIMASPSATTNYASFGSVRFNPPLEEGLLNSFVTYNPETGTTGSARNTTTNTNVSVSTHFAGDKGASIRVNNVSVTGGNLLAVHWEADTGY